MSQTTTDPVDEIRAIRKQISERHQDDPKKLVEYYINLQKHYAARLVTPCDQNTSAVEATRSPGNN